MSALVEKLILEPSESYPLYVLATRYSANPPPQSNSLDDYTLICLHAVGSHKESWEVTIQHLLNLECKSGHHAHPRIREVYIIECPNHGESAILNADILAKHYSDDWPTREYTRAAHSFLTAGPSRGARVDFRRRNIIAVGHCLGAIALFFMHEMRPRIAFTAVIAFEPALSPGTDYPDYREVFRKFQAWSWLRPNVWPSRKAALRDLSRHPNFKTWDPNVLRSYVDYALSTHPASRFQEPYTFNGVVVSTPREQESATYRSDGLVGAPLEACAVTSKQMPVHLIWGGVHDVLPSHLKHYISNHMSSASVDFMEGAGHMIVQEKPQLVANKIHDLLLSFSPIKAVL
ncbi:alpha/beta-hydrolase [Flammula alnicola]|nr:alpha/beta-hydrolase [Flammula alnicola]